MRFIHSPSAPFFSGLSIPPCINNTSRCPFFGPDRATAAAVGEGLPGRPRWRLSIVSTWRRCCVAVAAAASSRRPDPAQAMCARDSAARLERPAKRRRKRKKGRTSRRKRRKRKIEIIEKRWRWRSGRSRTTPRKNSNNETLGQRVAIVVEVEEKEQDIARTPQTRHH
eukprot:COSAG05_NODE_975_length_6350_cov_6.983523_7_plen_168_part_00